MWDDVQALQTSLHERLVYLQEKQKRWAAHKAKAPAFLEQREIASAVSPYTSAEHNEIMAASDKFQQSQIDRINADLETVTEQIRLIDAIAGTIKGLKDEIDTCQRDCFRARDKAAYLRQQESK